MTKIAKSCDQGVHLQVKAIPNASRSRIVGLLGDRLKVTVASPPEAGKANKAICRLFAKAFGLSPRRIHVVAGGASPLKTIELCGMNMDDLAQCVEPFVSPE